MTRINKTLAALFAVALFTVLTGSMFAQSTASTSGNAEARIVAGISIAKNVDLAFGQIVRSASAGTVTLDPSTNQRTAKGGVTLGQNAGFNAAEFEVTGEPEYKFQLTLPKSINITRQGGKEIMSVDGFKTTLGATNEGALDSKGSMAFSLGATLNVDANQATGTYDGSFSVTATYQ